MDTLEYILETKTRGHGAVLTTRPDATALEAVDEMCRAHVGALLVTTGPEVVGIVSERDIMTRLVLERRDPAATRVLQIMTADVVSVRTDVEPEQAMAIMTSRRCRHLPVVAEDGHVLGMISIGDLVRWVSQHHEAEIQVLSEYVAGKYPGWHVGAVRAPFTDSRALYESVRAGG